MRELPTWNGWVTDRFFCIHVSLAAAQKLRRLRADRQHKLRTMLEEIGDIAATMPIDSEQRPGYSKPLLQLRVGRITVRYSIDETARTLSVEHVIAPDDELVDEQGAQ